ncbi:MAG TPA: hypothetical protein VGT81_08190 [Casimicrobiaceae bacterium]|nr:hypothetical protein [Casimicrobiaceae bacterium]
MELRSWVIRGTLVGLVVLGIGGRLLMRVIAHMEGRIPVFTSQGSVTVVFAGTVAGALAGLIYYLVRRFVRQAWLRTAAFIVICEVIAWRGVHELLPRPQLMFMTLALVHLVIIDIMGRRMTIVRCDPAESLQPIQ